MKKGETFAIALGSLALVAGIIFVMEEKAKASKKISGIPDSTPSHTMNLSVADSMNIFGTQTPPPGFMPPNLELQSRITRARIANDGGWSNWRSNNLNGSADQQQQILFHVAQDAGMFGAGLSNPSTAGQANQYYYGTLAPSSSTSSSSSSGGSFWDEVSGIASVAMAFI